MFSIESRALPDGALLNRYLKEGIYTDCYVTEIPGTVTHNEYIIAFYTTCIFRLERIILKYFASRPSTDEQVTQLANGSLDSFAAWHVEDRCENQLLLCDFNGRTRSWLMVIPVKNDIDVMTRLYFGSAVLPVVNPDTGELSLGIIYKLLLGFHKLYSVVLLYAARFSLKK